MKQGKELFEYAIIRIVPKPEREEFINVGVVLYCKGHKFLQTRIKVDEAKVRAICGGICLEEIQEYLAAFEAITTGQKDCKSPIASLDMPSRFRWLTATRSTIVQTSKVHPGLSDNPAETLERLFEQMVL